MYGIFTTSFRKNTYFCCPKSSSGGIGRRAGFKIQFWQQSVGSIPTLSTDKNLNYLNINRLRFFVAKTSQLLVNNFQFLGIFEPKSLEETQ